jgi:hypothetical protein
MDHSRSPNFPFSHPDDFWLPAANATWQEIPKQIWVIRLDEWVNDSESVVAIFRRVLLEKSGLQLNKNTAL